MDRARFNMNILIYRYRKICEVKNLVFIDNMCS